MVKSQKPREIKLIYMKPKDIKILKEKIWKQNNKKCPILGKEVPLDKMVLDHKHKLKSEAPDKVRGAIREALEFRVNALAGKIENGFKRFGLDKIQDYDLPTFLRNMADYLENGSYCEIIEGTAKIEEVYYIHPKEVPKREKVSLSRWKRIAKYYLDIHPRKKKIPKKPTYITESFLELERLTDLHVKELQRMKEEKKAIRLAKIKKGTKK